LPIRYRAVIWSTTGVYGVEECKPNFSNNHYTTDSILLHTLNWTEF
jgi:hypothetical protein